MDDERVVSSAARRPPAGSALVRAIEILEVIVRSDQREPLAEICRSVGLPKATVYRILGTLEHAGIISREPGDKRYSAGPRLHDMTMQVLRHSPARAERHAILEELVEQIGETCNLTVPDQNHICYLDRIEAAWPLPVTLKPGSTVPLCASASGKLFLGHMARRPRERFVRAAPLVGYTGNTHTDPDRLLAELEQIRHQGWSPDREEYLPGISCVAVPVRNRRGEVVAAVAAQGPTDRLSPVDSLDIVPLLQAAADAIGKTFDRAGQAG